MADKDPALRSVWQAWKRIAARIAHIQGHVILGLIYILVLAPIACLFRLFRKDPLSLRHRRESSYWFRRRSIASIADFLKQQY